MFGIARIRSLSVLQKTRIRSYNTSTRIGSRPWILLAGLAGGGFVYYHDYFMFKVYAEVPPEEKKKEQRWENCGVYAWGSNSGRVAAPDSTKQVIKTAQRISFFDNLLLRDLKLDRRFGVAVLENGDVLEWGTGYSGSNNETEEIRPERILTGKDIFSVCLSQDRIVALSKSGKVYSIPVSKADQECESKPLQSSWIPLWTPPSTISYYNLTPTAKLGWGERVYQIAGGLEHVLMLTNRGRVFSAAASTRALPSKGQLGIAGGGEITGLRGHFITNVAAGDYHSLARDDAGHVFVFGDNSAGALGLEFDPEVMCIETPVELQLQSLYQHGENATVTSVYAGGENSYFSVDVRKPNANTNANANAESAVRADTWATGRGIYGGLANNRWTHISWQPSLVRALSGLCEYDESLGGITPIRVRDMSVGATHASAVLSNSTRGGRTNDEYGADVVLWGGNEFFQLGTGKRNNVNVPVHIRPMQSESVGAQPWFSLASDGSKLTKTEQRVECGRFVSGVYWSRR